MVEESELSKSIKFFIKLCSSLLKIGILLIISTIILSSHKESMWLLPLSIGFIITEIIELIGAI